MAYNGDAANAPTTYDDVSKFTAAMRDRSEYLETEAANAEEHARATRMRAEEARRVYETLAKLHESIQPKTVDSSTITGATVNVPPGGWQVRQ